MYTIKQIPEDFIVKELSNVEVKNSGEYSYFTLIKRNYTTQRAIEAVSKELRVPQKKIGFAGTKDKYAVTYQTISVKGNFNKNLKLKDIELIYLGKGDEPISLGDLYGNAFTITVRNIDDKEINPIEKVPNYFDEQRFSKTNVQVGMAIIKKNFKEAVNLILESNDEYRMKEYLEKHTNDYVGAIKKIPFKIQRLIINSVQSYIFNQEILEILKGNKCKEVKYSQGTFLFPENYEGIENKELEIVGFDSETNDSNKKILEELGIKKRDFIIRSMPDLTSEGTKRKMLVDVNNMVIEKTEDDELNQNKKKRIINFTLHKGSYATIVIKALFN